VAKGLVNEQNMTSAQESLTEGDEELGAVDIGKELERVKWFLWHGFAYFAEIFGLRCLKANNHLSPPESHSSLSESHSSLSD
jgi:hypothetical protein